ncbi:MAG: BolA family transcriptional regulator [Proteobacteria bacterium]|nr:BolA family transcriptional regulator [Pseudomonadota bacterium]HQR02665.1 BolA family protein [Rhodocyclaceae bacterium]
MNPIVTELKRRLACLQPVALEIIDESAQHAGHPGARSGGHFRLLISSALFAGKPTMARHRLVYDALGDLMRDGVHALSITAKTP